MSQCILGHDQYLSDLVIEKKISSLIKSLIIKISFFKYLVKSKVSCMMYKIYVNSDILFLYLIPCISVQLANIIYIVYVK